MNQTTRNILGIDYGEAKVGLAIADNETKIAFTYKTLKNNKDLFEELAEIIKEEKISKIIAGIPNLKTKDTSGSEALKFADLLRKKLKIEVEFQEEMFTTRSARRNLIEKGAKKLKEFDDQEAARIILQNWLDKVK